MVKHRTRQQIRRFLQNLPKEQLLEKSRAACKKLCDTSEFQKARRVMLFLSIDEEVETTVALQRAFTEGKTILVPAIDWDRQALIPVLMADLDGEMVTDRYGLRHPAQRQPMAISEVDLIVVPGISFDLVGNRLGRGGGFYDRLLGQDGFRGVSCGLSLEEQVMDEVPVLEHDVRLDMLVTDQEVRRF